MKARWWSFCFLAACAFSALQGISGAEDKTAEEPAATEVIAEFVIAKRGDVIILPVTIGDRSYRFLLSVASNRTTVDSRLRSLLGKRIEPERESADPIESPVDEYPALTMKIGELSFVPEKPVICRSLRLEREFLGHDLYGIVGMDFLKDRVVQIDFDEGKVRILTEWLRDIPREADLGFLLNVEGRRELLLEIPGAVPRTFEVDTNFIGPVAVRGDLMNELIRKKLVVYAQESAIVRHVTGARAREGLLRILKLEKWNFENLSVLESTHNRIGLAVLSQFQLIFDVRRHVLLLTPGARFGKPEELNWSGMDFLLKNGDVTVVNVGANCAGASAGIQPGDLLIEANGKPASEWSLFEIRRLFMEQKTVRARFHRPEQESHGAEEFTVSFENPKVTISQKEIIPTSGTDDPKP